MIIQNRFPVVLLDSPMIMSVEEGVNTEDEIVVEEGEEEIQEEEDEQ